MKKGLLIRIITAVFIFICLSVFYFISKTLELKEKKTEVKIVNAKELYSGVVKGMPTYYNLPTLISSFGVVRVEVEKDFEKREMDVIIPATYAPHVSGGDGIQTGGRVCFYVASLSSQSPFSSVSDANRTFDVGIYIPKSLIPDSMKIIKGGR